MKIKSQRIVEMIPGSIVILFVTLMIVLSIYNPVLAAYIVVFYSVYFIYQAIVLVILMVRSARETNRNLKIDWISKLNNIKEEKGIDWRNIYNAFIIPFANEGADVLFPTIERLVSADYPKQNKILVLATEERIESAYLLAQELKVKYSNEFYSILITRHKLENWEIVGKASNENWAARNLYNLILRENISPANVIVTSNDSDSRHVKGYMARLVYMFLTQKNPEKCIYQPIPMFFNNIWQVPFVSRIIATFSAQWQMSLALKPNRFMNFSTYAICLESLHQIDYWDSSIIPEDERLYWKAFFKYGDDLKVVPLFVPVFMDAVKSGSYARSLKGQYIQIRRWAWGASEIAYSLPKLIKRKDISFTVRIVSLFQQIRKAFEWALSPFILFFGLSLPSYINSEYSHSILSYSLPLIISKILTISTCLMIAVFYIESVFAPPKPSEWSILRKGFSIAQWITFPFVSIVFSAIPALEAQIRLFIGKPIQYVATEKKQ